MHQFLVSKFFCNLLTVRMILKKFSIFAMVGVIGKIVNQKFLLLMCFNADL